MDPLNALNAKLGKALVAVEAVTRSNEANAGSYTYRYTDLTSVLKVVKAALTPLNMAVTQPVGINDNDVMSVSTIIIDIDTGESMSFPGPGCPVPKDPQQQGSAISYFRRYALTSIFALEVEDDDGALAHRGAVAPTKRTEAEENIRSIVEALTADERAMFIEDFKAEFNASLSDLPESRHGAALKFAKFWITPETPETPATPATETEGN
jgi:hypothetical protein